MRLEQSWTDAEADTLRDLLAGMKRAYMNGENAMAFARRFLGRDDNLTLATLIAYDLQTGSYVRHAQSHTENWQHWGAQLAEEIVPHFPESSPSPMNG
ncbi:MAG: hypothetical protein LBF93_12805 [Zoogloeaceae bacterium]|jgi:hypothetical protein|nr:hypothetical protein [Zoogloeaceae bacterium]